MRLNAAELISRLNSSYWFVPLVVTLSGAALALSLLALDERVTVDADGPWAVLRPSSAEGARALLSAVIGAMITAISVTFSVTIVALTVAAQHFGPRVLSNFVRQTSAQLVLGTFLATFVYSVLALGAIGASGQEAGLPELTVSGAVVLVIMSIGALIFYVHHVSTTLQVGELASAIVLDLRQATADRDGPADAGQPERLTFIPSAPPDAAPVPAAESGYVQRIDYQAIIGAAETRNAVVWIRREPGTFLIDGTAMALVHPPTACDTELVATVQHACVVGRDRTLWHDPEFPVKQLVEIALRALSPGVNEPFTAITCIDRLTQGLAYVAAALPPRSEWCDSAGRVRVWVQPQSFEVLVHAAFDPIRIFAGANPAIYARLLDSVGELAWLVKHDGARRLLSQQAEIIRRAAERRLKDAADMKYVDARYQRAVQQLSGELVTNRR